LAYLALQNDPSQYDKLAFGIAIFGLTDWLDGAIARKFPSQRSIIGTALDPLGDKVLIISLALALTIQGSLPLPVAAAILGRDLFLIFYGFYGRYLTVSKPVTWKKYWDTKTATIQFKPSNLSKFNTFLQISLFLSLVAAQTSILVPYGLTESYFMYGLEALTTTTTCVTWYDYWKNYDKHVDGL